MPWRQPYFFWVSNCGMFRPVLGTTLPNCTAALFLVTFLIAGCDVLIPAHPDSYRFDGERVLVTVKRRAPPSEVFEGKEGKKGKQREIFKEALPAAAAAAVLAPVVLEYATKRLVQELEEETTKYAAEYFGFLADDEFYQSEEESAQIAIEGFEVTRLIEAEGIDDTQAMSLFLAVVSSKDNTAFQLKPRRAVFRYAKAKLPGMRWYLPWTWFVEGENTLDVDINVTIEGFWIDSSRKAHNEVLGSVNIPLRGIKLIGASSSPETVELPDIGSQWFPAVPRSRLGETFGTGTYVVKVRIREYDDFSKRVRVISEYIEANRAQWVNKLRNEPVR